MNKWFTGIKTIEELRQRYRELLKKYHPDNEGGSVEVTQEINAEYDRLFSILSEEKSANEETPKYDYQAENDAFKSVINKIIHINSDVEIIGSWIWVHSGYEYRELLKSTGFKFAPKKKCWCWHYGDYVRYHDKEITLDEIRQKYGSKKVGSKSRQYAIG